MSRIVQMRKYRSLVSFEDNDWFRVAGNPIPSHHGVGLPFSVLQCDPHNSDLFEIAKEVGTIQTSYDIHINL
ncbi:hypothetical protein B9Z55_019801 [Caenorhabditis nigoni]|uniref:Uncharacterized protein n=1 Tax=Caenorhabditis nigoni TaxID=1611254 RepID=A0A2G5TK14_9PELO|nr:hypothetical protein B9Z55_019801 [Caenorhabditis nigoni]